MEKNLIFCCFTCRY